MIGYICHPMKEKIKEGLFYSSSVSPGSDVQESFLVRSGDRISLTCRFSTLDCVPFTDEILIHQIEFSFEKFYLESFSQDFSAAHFKEYQSHDICCNTQMILHDIMKCSLKGAFRNMFLESKALALLVCFEKCSVAEKTECASCKFLARPVEKEKILKAKEIILSRLHYPPTTPELSVEIGINQCYLKKGFKELFGTTIYDYIQEQRMMKAKLLLSTNKFSVSRVAEEIGFSSTSSFSTAFKKFTGVFPSEMIEA